MQPFDYRQQVTNPFLQSIQGFGGGFQFGASLRAIEQQRQEAALKEEQMRQALERQNQFQTRVDKILQGGVGNATTEDFAELVFFTDKDTAKTLSDTFKSLDENTQRRGLQQISEVVSALANNQPEIAAQRLSSQAQALRNSGIPRNIATADLLDEQAKLATTNPEFLQFDLKYKLATLPGGGDALKNIEQVLATRREEAMAPERLAEQRAKALKAGVEADFSASQAVKDLALKQAQIDNYAQDQEIARENLKIAKLNADLKREENVLKRQELQQRLDQAKEDREEKVRKKVADANTAFGNFDNFLNTADRALAQWGRTKDGKVDPKKPSATVRAATGPLDVMFPTIQPDVANFEELIDTIKGQAFLAQVEKMKGLGALSDKEGDALRASLTNLSLRQSPEQLAENLLEAQRLILKARDATAKKYGVGAAPDRPAGPGGAAPAQVPNAMSQAVDQSVRSRADAIIRGQ
jgi:hypothetical protein